MHEDESDNRGSKPSTSRIGGDNTRLIATAYATSSTGLFVVMVIAQIQQGAPSFSGGAWYILAYPVFATFLLLFGLGVGLARDRHLRRHPAFLIGLLFSSLGALPLTFSLVYEWLGAI